mmetsp:Transcript_2639/g.9149  ORF Transcript_2639/g.9149 Transcript_2639/m.9149 type:complete len:816 (-) Transcript_2639:260-2707(-)
MADGEEKPKEGGGGCCGCCRKLAVTDEAGSVIIYKPYEDRKCTDCFFCILFLVFWIVMVAIAGLAISAGDPDRLLYANDYKGRTCGTVNDGGDMTLTKKVYYPRIVEDIVTFAQSGDPNPLNIKLYGVCMAECPALGDIVCDDEGEVAMKEAVDETGNSRAKVWSDVQSISGWASYEAQGLDTSKLKGRCWLVPLVAKEYFFRCLWQRTKEQESVAVCLSPPALANVPLTDETPQEVHDACITKRQTTTTRTEGEAQENPLISQMFDATERVGRYVSDAKKAQLVILVCGLVVAIILGFLFLIIARKFAGCMVWTTIFLCIVMLTIFTFYAYWKAGLITSDDLATVTDNFATTDSGTTEETTEEPAELSAATTGDQSTRWKWFAYISTAVTVIVVVLVVFWYKKIKIAVAVIKEASDAVRKMPLMLLLPIVSTIFILILVLYFLIIASYISSGAELTTADVAAAANEATEATTGQNLLCAAGDDGEIDTNKCAEMPSIQASYEGSSLNDTLLAIHFFGFLWTNQFIQGITVVIIAGAVSRYYFTHNKKEDLPKYPLKEAIKTTFRYHLGSIAFGALVIAIVQFIRAVLEYLNKQSAEAQKKSIVLRIFFKCIRCCLWCFEKCIKFLTAYAFIIVAMKGSSFCTACKDVIKTILKNPVQIGVVNAITTILFLLGKIAIVITCALVAFQWLENDAQFQRGGENQLESYMFPLLIILLLSYAVATVFMNVYALSVDTILLCFLFDRELNNGDDKPYFMSATLLKAIGASTKQNKALTGQSSESDDEAEKKAGAAPDDAPATPADGGAAASSGGGGELL